MPLISPDLSEVNKPIEPGSYPAKIESVEVTTAKSSGNPMIVVKMAVSVGEGKTKPRTARLVITGAGAFGFEQLLRACKFNDYANALRAGQKQDWDTDQLIGQSLIAVIEADVYNGAPTDKITGYLPA